MTIKPLVVLAVAAFLVLSVNALNVNEQQTLQAETGAENSVDFCEKITKRASYFVSDGSSKFNTTYEKLQALCKALPRTKADRVYYHYSDFRSCIRWGMNMRIDEGEMNYLASQHSGQAAGGGYYLSGNSRTSRSYGPCVTYVLIKKNTPIWDANVARKTLGVSSISIVQKAVLGNSVPFIDYYNAGNDWWVIHHHALATRVRGGPLDPLSRRNSTVGSGEDGEFDKARTDYPLDSIKTRSDVFKLMYRGPKDEWDSIETAVVKENLGPKANVLRDSLNFLKSAMLLLDYFDGFSLLRALALRPDNPWAEFDPEHFEGFKATVEKYYMSAVTNTNKGVIGVSLSGKYGDGKSTKQAWAKKMAEQFLPGLYQEMAKAPVPYRDSEVRAGGDYENREFETTPFQIQVMQTNPLLEVYARKVDNSSFRAYYFYPDAKHYAKMSNLTVMIMSNGVVRQNSDSLWMKKAECPDVKSCYDLLNRVKAGGAFGPLTQEMVKQLVANYFYRIHGKDVSYETEVGMGAIVDLVGIHPCKDFNGRTTRFFAALAHMESGQDPPTSFVSDMDLVTTRRLYSTFVKRSTQLYHDLRKQMISKMLHTVMVRGVKAENRHYWDLPAFRALVRSLDVFLGPKMVWPPLKGSMKPFWEMVRKRQFVSIFTMLNGGKTGWNGYAGATAVDYTLH